MNWKQTDITTGKQKFCSITKIKAYTILGRIDDLTVVDTMNVLMSNYFKQPGTYDVIVNLKTFEITAELLPE